MDYNKNEVMSLMKADVNDNLNVNVSSAFNSDAPEQLSFNWSDSTGFYDDINSHKNLTVWDYWQGYYYPYVIKESYPVYIQERAQDKGKMAFEILKTLKDKKLIKIEKVEDFIEAMDAIIKTL